MSSVLLFLTTLVFGVTVLGFIVLTVMLFGRNGILRGHRVVQDESDEAVDGDEDGEGEGSSTDEPPRRIQANDLAGTSCSVVTCFTNAGTFAQLITGDFDLTGVLDEIVAVPLCWGHARKVDAATTVQWLDSGL